MEMSVLLKHMKEELQWAEVDLENAKNKADTHFVSKLEGIRETLVDLIKIVEDEAID